MLAGCGATPVTTPATKESAVGPERLLTATQIESPLVGSEVDLGLVNEDQVLHIGDTLDSVFNTDFPKPERAANLSQMPPGLDTSFRARGWETNEQAFGVVLKSGRVALAILTTENADEDGLAELVADYEDRFGPAPERVGAGGVRYWFWQDRDVRLMICNAYDEQGRMSVTTALGLKTLMTFLRMDVQDARTDREEAERLRKSQAPNSQSSEPSRATEDV